MILTIGYLSPTDLSGHKNIFVLGEYRKGLQMLKYPEQKMHAAAVV